MARAKKATEKEPTVVDLISECLKKDIEYKKGNEILSAPELLKLLGRGK